MDFILKKRTNRPLGGGQLVVFVDSLNCVRVPHNCTCVFACVRPMSSCVPMSTSPLCCCRVRQAFLFSRDQDKLSAEVKPESIFLCWFLSNAADQQQESFRWSEIFLRSIDYVVGKEKATKKQRERFFYSLNS